MNTIAIDRRPVLLRAALAFAMLVLLLGAVQPAASSCEGRAARMHQAVLAESLDNWEPVTDTAVLIWTRHSARAYLVRLDRALDGLTDAEVIDLVDGDHDRTICACGHDAITIHGVGVAQTGRIVAIERLSARRTAELEESLLAARPGSLMI